MGFDSEPQNGSPSSELSEKPPPIDTFQGNYHISHPGKRQIIFKKCRLGYLFGSTREIVSPVLEVCKISTWL